MRRYESHLTEASKCTCTYQQAAVDAMIRRQRVETIQAALAALGERPDMIEAMQHVGVPTLRICGSGYSEVVRARASGRMCSGMRFARWHARNLHG
jgi:plasmid stabilization system protein ParE